MSTLFRLLKFLIKNKKYFLIPIVLLLFLVGGLLVMSQGTPFAPLIYTIF